MKILPENDLRLFYSNEDIKLKANKEHELCKLVTEMRKNTESLIDFTLNISTLVNDLSSWRIFQYFFFEKHHYRLKGLVQIEQERKRKELLDNRLKTNFYKTHFTANDYALSACHYMEDNIELNTVWKF